METIDASIPLQVKQFDLSKSLSMAQMAIQLRAAQREEVGQNALKQIYSDPNSFTPNGDFTPQALQAIGGVDPQTAMKLQDDNLTKMLRQAQIKHEQTETGKLQWGFVSGAAGTARDAYDLAISKGASQDQARAAGTKARNDTIAASGGVLDEDMVKSILSHPFDPDQALQLARTNKDYLAGKRDERAERSSDRQDEAAKRSADAANRAADAADRQAKAADRAQKREDEESAIRGIENPQHAEITAADGTKTQAEIAYNKKTKGYEYAQGGKPVTGDVRIMSAAENNATGGRTQVFTARQLTDARDAVSDLENVAELPISISKGFFAGREQGPHLIDAAREVLVNTVTSQEVQDYNVTMTGLARAVAGLETGGTASAGGVALMKRFEGLDIKEGDSQFTKMRKLATLRQNAENGIDTLIDSPGLGPDQRKSANQLKARIAKAIPYTPHDVTMLEQSKDPKMTMSQQASAAFAKPPNKAPKVWPGTDAEWDILTPEEKQTITKKADE